MPDKHLAVAVVSSEEHDRRRLEAAATESGLHAECAMCSTVEQLRAQHERERLDLVAYWHERAPIFGEDVQHYLSTLPDGPQLLLVTDHIRAHDYVRAKSMRADDVVDCDNLSHFDLAARRALQYVELRRKLHAARSRLEREHVVDRSELDQGEDPDATTRLMRNIDRALRSDSMELVFQRMVPVGEDAHDSFETFVRMRTEDGYLMPNEFLPVATRYGLLPAIDRWVVRHATERYIAEQATRPRQLRFFVKVSAHTLVEARAVATLLKTIARARPRPGSFVIEIDKETILSRLGVVKSLNDLVKKVGLQFAIDHYEASDSRLNYLDHIAVDYIRLHRALVSAIDTDRHKYREVERIVAEARVHGIRVIASQVERATEFAALYRIGVDYVQGYLIGEPSGRLEEGAGSEEILG